MDLATFRSSHVWLKVVYEAAVDEHAPDDLEPVPSFIARVAYAPAALSDEDVEFLATIETARLIDLKRIPEPKVPATENREQRRQRERAERRADATPPDAERFAYVDYIVRLVKQWDIKLDGEPLPITRAAIIANMEPGMRVAIVLSIMKDYLERPNRMISSALYSGTTGGMMRTNTAQNGQTGPTPASEQNGQGENVAVSSRGSI